MIYEKLQEDMKKAMKEGAKDRLSTIRMLINELKNEKINSREDLTEATEHKVLASYAKKRKEMIETYSENERQDLADKESAEYEITMSYLPKQMSEDELKAIVEKHIVQSGGGKQAFGLVMKSVMAEVGSVADGKTVSAIVKQLLG
jgi:uncharacterized protein YqeY